MPTISIIVPVYKVEQYLHRCVDSILNQTFTDFELILVDDGSPDNCGIICDEYAAKDDRIVVIHQDNGGISAARNAGLDVAKGQYIMFVDSDDYIDINLCQKLFDEINGSNDIDCAICGFSYFNDEGLINTSQTIVEKHILTGIGAIKDIYLYNRNRLNIIMVWGKIFKRDVWNELRFTNGIYYEDLDIMPYIYTKCDCVVSIPFIGYHYYQRVGSITHGTGTDNKRVTDSISIREKHVNFFESINEFEIANSVRKKTMDLIVTSAINGWIPKEYDK